MEQSQTHRVVLSESFVDDYLNPANSILVRLSKSDIQLYSATLSIDANLGFIRAILHRWFFSSAFIGISLIFFIEWVFVLELWLIVFILSKRSTLNQRSQYVSNSNSSANLNDELGNLRMTPEEEEQGYTCDGKASRLVC